MLITCGNPGTKIARIAGAVLVLVLVLVLDVLLDHRARVQLALLQLDDELLFQPDVDGEVCKGGWGNRL